MNQYKQGDFQDESNRSRLLDQTDHKIISLLKQNSRMQWQEIGELVHLTGQAVSNRVRRLEQLGVIQEYTIYADESLYPKPLEAFVTVFMKTTDHAKFQKFIHNHSSIKEAHRISGEGCYLIIVLTTDQLELTEFLDEVLEFGNYRVNLSIERLKR